MARPMSSTRVQKETFDLVDGTSTLIGSIHDQVFGQGVVHDVGIVRFNADGSLAFEAGQHRAWLATRLPSANCATLAVLRVIWVN